MENSFFWDEDEKVWYSVGYTQQFKARVDPSPPAYVNLYIPWGKAKNDNRQLWTCVAGSQNKDRLSEKLKKFNVPIGSEINGDIQPKYIAI